MKWIKDLLKTLRRIELEWWVKRAIYRCYNLPWYKRLYYKIRGWW